MNPDRYRESIAKQRKRRGGISIVIQSKKEQ